ncbi:MAG: adenylylsulfate reductase [Clostridia bacterium]|nr:MAG: adenylylsulfate reductase [Clostridia bacterium]
MGVVIDGERCTGCPRAQDPPCVRACPGDVLQRVEGKVGCRSPGECWDCAACLKACPHGAAALVLPLTLGGGAGVRLMARSRADVTEWSLEWPDGRQETFVTHTRERR